MCTHMHTSVQTQIHTRTRKQTLTRTCTHTLTHKHTHTHTHSLISTHTHTHAHTHARARVCVHNNFVYASNSINVYTKFLQDIWTASVCTAISGNGTLDGRYGSDIHQC